MGLAQRIGDEMARRHHPELIKAKIRMAYGSVAAFELANGLPRSSVRDVLRGRSVRRVAEAVATFLDLPLNDLFPGRYTQADDTSQKGDSHRLNERGE
jgi:lambda repressor-like predicted transcriptional regulator